MQKLAKHNFVARHYDLCYDIHKGNNDVRQNPTWYVSACGDPYVERAKSLGPFNISKLWEN